MEFVRHVDRRRWLRNDTVFPDAFRCREGERALSLTLRSPEIKDQNAVDEYHLAAVLPSGDLPALVIVTAEQLAAAGLQPIPDVTAGPWGHLHHVIECPDEASANQLAKFATENGVLRRLVRKG